MILIFTERSDINSRKVISYLNTYNEPFEVFLENDTIELEYEINNCGFNFSIFKNGLFICTSDEIKSIWYRRTDIRISWIGNGNFTQDNIKFYAEEHVKTRLEQAQRCLNNKRCLGKFGFGNFNKIEFLEICSSLGLDIPKTIFTRSKKKLIAFFTDCNNQIITKSIASPFECLNITKSGEIDGYRMGYTLEIDSSKLDQIPEQFDLSLFQEKLEKLFEIRVIYLNGMIFSQAMFSQSRIESSLDYRLGYDSGMRMCNYTLPTKINKQVTKLMKTFDLNFGSIDIVYTTDHRYVFLEVNPNGQYDAVSLSINANIDYEISKFLMLK